MTDQQRIIMNYTVPPSAEDLEVMAASALEHMPEELSEYCEGLAVQIEDLADELIEQELELETAFDLPALYRSGKEISPGVEKKTANDDDILILYRRPILDLWCESEDDIAAIIRQVMIEEIARHHDFSDEDIEELSETHYQGMF